MNQSGTNYIPALKYNWLTSLYDPLISRFESTFKLQLVEQAKIASGHRVLDLGCGTATLTLLIKKTQLDAEVVGLDGDPNILEIARAKAAKAGLLITLDQGMSFDLPYPDNSFDRILSSLVFHHLTRENKIRTLEEVFRVLTPNGELHVADWGKAQNALMRAAFLPVQMLDSFITTADNVKGLLPELLGTVGLEDVQQTAQYSTLFGTLALLQARKPCFI